MPMPCRSWNRKDGWGLQNNWWLFQFTQWQTKLAPENLFVFTRYTFDVADPKCQFWTKNVEKADSKTKEIALAHLQKLYHSATSTYLSGYVFAENKFNEAEYQQLKQDIYSLKLDQKYPFAPVFELIECYAKGDKKAYFEMFKQKNQNSTHKISNSSYSTFHVCSPIHRNWCLK